MNIYRITPDAVGWDCISAAVVAAKDERDAYDILVLNARVDLFDQEDRLVVHGLVSASATFEGSVIDLIGQATGEMRGIILASTSWS